MIFTKITVNVCAFCPLGKLTVNGYHVATMNEAERLTEKEINMKYFTNINSLDELKKERPGIEYVMDIEKKSWER